MSATGIAVKGLDKVTGLKYPIVIDDNTAIHGPIAWRVYLHDQAILKKERDLLCAYARGEVLYEEVRHLAEETQ